MLQSPAESPARAHTRGPVRCEHVYVFHSDAVLPMRMGKLRHAICGYRLVRRQCGCGRRRCRLHHSRRSFRAGVPVLLVSSGYTAASIGGCRVGFVGARALGTWRCLLLFLWRRPSLRGLRRRPSLRGLRRRGLRLRWGRRGLLLQLWLRLRLHGRLRHLVRVRVVRVRVRARARVRVGIIRATARARVTCSSPGGGLASGFVSDGCAATSLAQSGSGPQRRGASASPAAASALTSAASSGAAQRRSAHAWKRKSSWPGLRTWLG